MGNAIKNWEKKQRKERRKEIAEINREVGSYLFKDFLGSKYGHTTHEYNRKREKEG